MWLESRAEDDGTRMLFVAMRGSLNRIAGDVGLMVDVARRLRSLDRGEGEAPGEAGDAGEGDRGEGAPIRRRS